MMTTAENTVNAKGLQTIRLAGCRTVESAMMIAGADEWMKAQADADEMLAEYFAGYAACASVVSAGPLAYVANDNHWTKEHGRYVRS